MSPIPQRLLTELREGSGALSADLISALSDLGKSERSQFLGAWVDIPSDRRLELLEQMGRLADERFELDFEAIDRAALNDPDPRVRCAAIRNLWENEDPALADHLLEILQADPAQEPVRAAARALGQFVLLGELGELDNDQYQRIVAGLSATAAGSSDEAAQRMCVESLGYSSQPQVAEVIRRAYESERDEWRASALVAIGRSANPAWADRLLPMLQHPAPTVRLEAVRACGELEVRSSIPDLVDLLDDSDPEVRRAAIWSLGQIGGRAAFQALVDLQRRAGFPEESELIECALENLAFVDGTGRLPLYRREDDELDDEGDAA